MTDFLGRQIEVGARIVYPQRFAGELGVVLAEVYGIELADGRPRLKVKRLRESERESVGAHWGIVTNVERVVVVVWDDDGSA